MVNQRRRISSFLGPQNLQNKVRFRLPKSSFPRISFNSFSVCSSCRISLDSDFLSFNFFLRQLFVTQNWLTYQIFVPRNTKKNLGVSGVSCCVQHCYQLQPTVATSSGIQIQFCKLCSFLASLKILQDLILLNLGSCSLPFRGPNTKISRIQIG